MISKYEQLLTYCDAIDKLADRLVLWRQYDRLLPRGSHGRFHVTMALKLVS